MSNGLLIPAQGTIEVDWSKIQFHPEAAATLAEYQKRRLIDCFFDGVSVDLTFLLDLPYKTSELLASMILNDSGVPGVSVKEALDNLAGGVTGASDMLISGGRAGSSISNVYLRGPGGTPMNLSGYVIPFNVKIVGLSLATRGIETWVFEVRRNNNPIILTSLAAVAVERAYNNAVNVDLNAGDEIQFYCNGTNIGAPSGSVVLRRR